MRIACDLDGVIAQLRRPGQEYADLEPMPGAGEKLRALRAAGHYIIITTARHMKTCEGNIGQVIARQGLITLEWLKRHHIEYDELHFGKPHAQVYIDDNALCFHSWNEIDIAQLPRSTEEQWADRSDGETTAIRPTTVIMPMAGRGSRFRGSRFSDVHGNPPKPLIDVAGQPMVWWALQSLRGVSVARMVFVVLEAHAHQFGLQERLQQLASAFLGGEMPVEVVIQKGFTAGQLCTVMQARHYITENSGVLILSADTFVDSDVARHINTHESDCAGLISVADVPGDQWSFARADDTGRVVEVAERRRISSNVSTGIYYFARGDAFLNAAEDVITHQEKTNDEFYVIPVYKRLFQPLQRVALSRARHMWDMGNPEALERFLSHLRTTFLASLDNRSIAR